MSRGLICPDCAGELRDVVDSRPNEHEGLAVIKRTRRCANCLKRHITLELRQVDWVAMKPAIARAMIQKLLEEWT